MNQHLTQYEIFLGGNDLEMDSIRGLLADRRDLVVHDRHLSWHAAAASSYGSAMADTLARARIPVLVELRDDVGAQARGARIIDHHDLSANLPAALRQVFDLLGLPNSQWTRRFELIAANDRAYLHGMRALGASIDEMREIRAADRRAQGITSEQEADGVVAVRAAEHPADGVTVVRLPHDRTAVVTDQLHELLGGPGYQVLAVFSPGEVNVFAPAGFIARLVRLVPGNPSAAWSGGDPENEAYWGTRLVPDSLIGHLIDLSKHRSGSSAIPAAGL